MLRTACKADFDTLCVLSCICMTVSGGVGGGWGVGIAFVRTPHYVLKYHTSPYHFTRHHTCSLHWLTSCLSRRKMEADGG